MTTVIQLSAYVRERVPLRRVGPLIIGLCLAAGGWSRASGPASMLADAGFALLLVFQFRLWDDLADRARDRVRHPERVLVRAASIRPFCVLVAALAVVNLILAARRAPAISVPLLLLLDLGFAIGYRIRAGRTAMGDHLLLAKYPAFVLILAGADGHPNAAIVWSAVTLYLALCLYEAWHDPESPSAGRPILLACEAALLAMSAAGASASWSGWG